MIVQTIIDDMVTRSDDKFRLAAGTIGRGTLPIENIASVNKLHARLQSLTTCPTQNAGRRRWDIPHPKIRMEGCEMQRDLRSQIIQYPIHLVGNILI